MDFNLRFVHILLFLFSCSTVYGANTRLVHRPDTRNVPKSVRDNFQIAHKDYIQDLDYTEKHIVLFQSPESVHVSDVERGMDQTFGGDQERTRTRSRTSSSDANQVEWDTEYLQNVRKRDKDDKLFTTHGFVYLGRVSAQLPDFHVIERNASSRAEDDQSEYEQHLRDVFGATWISSQERRPRPLRDEDSIPLQAEEEYKYRVPSERRPRVPRQKSVQKRAFDDARSVRKARGLATKLDFVANRDRMEEFGRGIRQSALRRTLLMTIQPNGPDGRTLTSSWSSRRLQAIEDELKSSYLRNNVPSDPLVKKQWFIHGGFYTDSIRAQREIPIPGGVFLDVMPLWKYNIDGNGVVISVVDDGVNFIHSDLRDKFVPMLSTDMAELNWINQDQTDERDQVIQRIRAQTQNGLPLVGQFHGTAVASIAAGSPSDGTCGTGVAPGALLSSIRLIGPNEAAGSGVGSGHMLTELQEALALSYKCINLDLQTGKQKLENMVYVVSWGPQDSIDQSPTRASPIVRAAIQGCTEYGRKGFGSIYVMAAGNGKALLDSVDLDGYASMRYTIAVGSISRTGYPLSYSEGGESLLVTTPSGDGKRGIVTATTMGSFYNSRMDTLSAYKMHDVDQTDPDHMDNAVTGLSSTGCTTTFGGTSASAPMIAGVVAMMLQSNPRLSWKDVQDILVRSCDKPHYGEIRNERQKVELQYLYRDILPVKLAQDRKDSLYLNQENPDVLAEFDFEKENLDEKSLAVGMEMLNHIKNSLYILYASSDPLEWSENRETGLHHSRLMGFGIPNVTVAISMSRSRVEGTRLDNDYAVRSHNLVQNMVHYAFSAYDSTETSAKAKEVEFLKRAGKGKYYTEEGVVRQKQVTAWHVQLDRDEHPVQRIYNHRDMSRSSPNTLKSDENFIVEYVELYVNATMPASIANTQIALCDRNALCSLFIPGMPFATTVAVPQQLEYTFSTAKYWGQANPYVGGWVILIRNIYPTRSASLAVHELTLTVYGHYL